MESGFPHIKRRSRSSQRPAIFSHLLSQGVRLFCRHTCGAGRSWLGRRNPRRNGCPRFSSKRRNKGAKAVVIQEEGFVSESASMHPSFDRLTRSKTMRRGREVLLTVVALILATPSARPTPKPAEGDDQ